MKQINDFSKFAVNDKVIIRHINMENAFEMTLIAKFEGKPGLVQPSVILRMVGDSGQSQYILDAVGMLHSYRGSLISDQVIMELVAKAQSTVCDCGGFKTYASWADHYHSHWCSSLKKG